MSNQKHLPPDWLIEISLAVVAFAILIMGVIMLVKRLQGSSRKGARAKPKSGLKGKRRKGRR